MHASAARSVRATLVVLALVVSVAAVPAAASASVADGDPSSAYAGMSGIAAGDTIAQQSTPTAASNNTSVRHANPDEAESEDTAAELRAQLTARLSDRLERSSVQISEGQYDRATQLLGEEYVDTLGKYADVARENGEEETAEDFERAGETQRNLSDSLAEYRETEQAYQEAKQNGNEAEARRLARELARISDDIDRQSRELDQTYTRLGNETDVDFSNAQERVRTTQREVAESSEQIQREELSSTDLSVTAAGKTASFVDPLRIEGQLTAADGSPITEQSITLRVGEQQYATTTDSEGAFAIDYRPAMIPVDASQVGVRYVPDASSVYVGSNASVPISVEQVNASVEFASVPGDVAFNDSVAASGRVVVDGRPVPNLSVGASIGNQSLDGNRTSSDGQFVLNGTFPPNVAAGEQTLRVASGDDRAVVVDAGESVTVTSTPTDLTLSVSSDGGTTVATGRLTADGTGVAGQQLSLSVDGSAVTESTTTESGRYRIRFDNRLLHENSTVRVRFDGSGTNLESASASVTNRASSEERDSGPAFGIGPGGGDIPGLGGSGGSGGDGANAPGSGPVSNPFGDGIAPSAAATVLLLAACWYAVRRWVSEDAAEVDEGDSNADSEIEEVEQGPPPLQLLARGQMQAALLAAYQSVQRTLTPSLGGQGSMMTHRQFYRACQRAGTVPMDSLRVLNDAYEQAVYSNRSLSLDEARDAVLAAEQIITSRGDDGKE